MTRRLSRRSTVNVRSGVLGLMLGVPLLAGPVLAQDAPTVGDAEDPLVETVIPDEQPRVLISEVLIEGLSGHPESWYADTTELWSGRVVGGSPQSSSAVVVRITDGPPLRASGQGAHIPRVGGTHAVGW